MLLTFRIEYITRWGEEIRLLIGDQAFPMQYNPGGIWSLEIEKGRRHCFRDGAPYHYELWEGGRMKRREWRGHTVAAPLMEDNWQDVPESAPFYTSGFSDGVLTLDRESGKSSAQSPDELYRSGWKCAGTAIPVFSIRTEDSFGIGDFHDLKKMADWAVATGQRVLQLLPVNDTTATLSWLDSYPYSANSIYALHPQFVYLPDAGVKVDKAYRTQQAELENLPQVDYEKVNKAKDRLMRKAFASTWKKLSASEDFQGFVKENEFWLTAYCAYRILTVKYGTADPSAWGKFSTYGERKIRTFVEENREEADYHTFVQYHLNRQLREARDYARYRGVILKGDLPIGVSRTSVDAWQNPGQFHMNCQAGAPPDAFSADGQNWSFPTYDWDAMARDGFSWWKARLRNMEQYFDAFRIDHILGFFRIWEIPVGLKSGLFGHFNPALPYSEDELKAKGFDPADPRYVEKGSCDTLFVEDTHRKGMWHPRIAARDSEKFMNLPEERKNAFIALHDDYFYRRHEAFWRDSAMSKLPYLLESTRMLACGEDLGMIPACVPSVMDELRIVSLEIQRMPKDSSVEFADTWRYPYLSVCATSTHDMLPLRGWWREDRQVTRHFWNKVLGQGGDAPEEITPDICRSIIMMHLQSKSLFAILPLQDWLSLRPELCLEVPEDERINIPVVTPFYWRFRMKTTVEQLLSHEITPYLKELISASGRS